MSCCCNQSPCVCVPQCPEACSEVLDYSALNINLAGVGTYDSTLDRVFQFRGIRSTNANLTIALNNALHTIDIELSALTIASTTTFANAATRANAVPNFEGQLGVQLDTDVLYIATGVGAGAWTGNFVQMDKTVVGTAGQNTVLSIQNHGLYIQGVGTGQFQIDDCNINLVTCITSINNGAITITDAEVALSGTTILNFADALNTIQILGVAVPANSVLVTTATLGRPGSKLITAFISTSNTQAGYVSFTNPVVRKTCDTTTVTLPELAQIVGTLIECLKGVLLPAA